MSDELLPKTERRALRYDFTAKETHDLSMQLANETKKLSAIEEEKSSVASQYAAKVKESKATCNKLSNMVADGYEIRDIECEVEYHKPQQGKKTIIRKDINKVTAIEAMTEWEWNLFNQPPDESEENTSDKKKGKGGKKAKVAQGKKGSGKNKKGPEQEIDNDLDEVSNGINELDLGDEGTDTAEEKKLDGSEEIGDADEYNEA